MLSMIGVDEVECAGMMRAHLGEDLDFQAFDTRWRELCRARHAEGIAQKSGADDAVARSCRRRNSRVLSQPIRGPRPRRRKLEQSGLHRHFAHVVGFDLVTAPKPAPDVYLMAAELLGVDPADCLAFEDSDPGVAAALAAGMTVVQVPDLIPSRTNRAHFNAESLALTGHILAANIPRERIRCLARNPSDTGLNNALRGWRGRTPRQPGQVRKEATVTSSRLGRCPASHPTPRTTGGRT